MHGAAHVFFENKLADMETMFNEKLKKLEKKVKWEVKEVTKVQNEQLSLIRKEIRTLQHDVRAVRQSEEDLSQLGLDKLRRLSKNVKEEVHDIKKIKSEVKNLKTEIKGIKKVENELSHNGMDHICDLQKRFSFDIHEIKEELGGIKEELSNAKEHENEDQEIKSILTKLHSKQFSQEYITSVFSTALEGFFAERVETGDFQSPEYLSSGSGLGSAFTSSLESHIDSEENVKKVEDKLEADNRTNGHREQHTEECVEN